MGGNKEELKEGEGKEDTGGGMEKTRQRLKIEGKILKKEKMKRELNECRGITGGNKEELEGEGKEYTGGGMEGENQGRIKIKYWRKKRKCCIDGGKDWRQKREKEWRKDIREG